MNEEENVEGEKKNPFDQYRADDPNFGRMTFKIELGETLKPEYYAYPPGTEIKKDGMSILYGQLTDKMKAAIYKEIVILFSFLTEDDRKIILDRIDLNKPIKPHELENWIIRMDALDEWTDKEIADYISQNFGRIELETVKKRRQRMFNKLQNK